MNVDGLIQFQKTCEKVGILPIMGCEAYIVPDMTIKVKGDKRGHITLLIKNQIGFENLCQMLTVANLQGFYYKPRIDFNLLKSHCEGLVILTGCGSSFLNLTGGTKLFEDLHSKIGGDLYLEVMPHKMEEQKSINKLCLSLLDKYGSKLVATNDCHYILLNDDKVHEVLLAIQTKSKMNDQNRFRFTENGLYLRTADEMIEAFRSQGMLDNRQIRQSIKNTIEVAEKCSSFRIKKQEIYLPTVPGYENVDCSDFLKNLCDKKLNELIGKNKIIQYQDRLKEEWNLINRKKFAPYFMIVWELVEWCKKNDIMVGPGRGSCGGSLALFLIGVTSVDPLIYNLLFSRFIAEDRMDLPDIDLDFEDKKRHLVREHLESLYGKNNVTSISTFLTMKGRAAIRDVARVFDIPLNEVDPFAKMIEAAEGEDNAISVAAKSDAGKDFYRKYPEVVQTAIKLEGQVRGTGSHAAGVIISADDLTKGTRGNLAIRSNLVVSNWDMSDTEYMGLMKLDVLGLNTLSVLNETKRLAKENGKMLIFNRIPLNDKDVFNEISAGHNIGVFQLSAWATTKLAKEIKCKSINDISDIIALVRPGAFNAGATGKYIKRKYGEKWDKKHYLYEEILKDTYGVIAYQEQVMDIIHKVAGLPYTTADTIRKVIGKKRDAKEFKPFEDAFIKGCLKMQTLSAKEAKEFWVGLQESAHYLFNRSHSVEYAIVGYWTAYCKCKFPTEFICASLTFGTKDKKEEIIKEAYRLGLNLVLPKIGISDTTKWIAQDNNLLVPFIEIKGVGEKLAAQYIDNNKNKIERDDNIGNKPSLKGFFTSQKVLKVKKTNNKLDKLLGEINALFIAGDMETLTKYFSFPIEKKMSKVNISKTPTGTVAKDTQNKLKSTFFVTNKSPSIIPVMRSSSLKLELVDAAQITFGFKDCYDCSLGKECEYGPVLPSIGKYNIMLVGEAPDSEEDEEGQGFVGKAGQLLWKELAKYNLGREQFYCSNVCKCFPRLSKTPDKNQIITCGKWLQQEISIVQPCLILAFGNIGLKGFGNISRITLENGKVEWNESLHCWIAWCMHPSSILHNPSNQRLFEDGIKSFAEKINALGGII